MDKFTLNMLVMEHYQVFIKNSIMQQPKTRKYFDVFAFCVVTTNDEHTKPRFKGKLKG